MAIQHEKSTMHEPEGKTDGAGLQARIDRDWKILENVQCLIERADSKAGLLLGLEILMVGYLIFNLDNLSRAHSNLGWVSGTFLVLAASTIIRAFVLLGSVVCPRLSHEAQKQTLIYATHINRQFGRNCQAYGDAAKDHSMMQWAEDIESQIVDNSEIAQKKMKAVRSAWFWTLWAATALAVGAALLRLSNTAPCP